MSKTVLFLPLAGEAVSPDDLVLRRARDIATFLSSEGAFYSSLVSSLRIGSESEAVIFDVDVEVGQAPVADIRRSERIAAIFDKGDDQVPKVLALRADFPQVPHLNLQIEEFPRSLCLYEQSWQEVKVRWTGASFVERIREWLARTAEGNLHGDDQPLEPTLGGPFARLVVPTDLATDADAAEKLVLYHHGEQLHGGVYTARRPSLLHGVPPARFVSTTFSCPPQQHGVIKLQPQNLADLRRLLAEAGFDLISPLKARLARWQSDQEILQAILIIVVFLPKKRHRDSNVEAIESWAFIAGKTVAEVGASLGVFGVHNGKFVPVIGGVFEAAADTDGIDIPISVLNPTPALSRARAASLNGLQHEETLSITAIGLGALGSQLIPHLVRAGYGKWALIDDDLLLPHNVTRHALTADAVGFGKAEVMSLWLNSILEEDAATKAVAANALMPGDKRTEFESAMKEAEVIVDLSASLAVSRMLASSGQWNARRLSLFLNPTGTDLILLAEDRYRETRLDFLEMLYYREVVRNPRLSNHIQTPQGQVRYAQSCRDLTQIVPGDAIALHAAIGSRALRQSVASDVASVRIWLSDSDLTVSSISVACSRPIVMKCGQWTVISDDALLQKIAGLRTARLPNETGGVLIGHIDAEHKTLYVVEALGSPPDSKEWPTVYIRGADGLAAAVEEIQHRTGSMLQYVGEWHSHPDGYSCEPSGDDRRAFTWLANLMQIDGYPGLMLIAGQEVSAWYVETME